MTANESAQRGVRKGTRKGRQREIHNDARIHLLHQFPGRDRRLRHDKHRRISRLSGSAGPTGRSQSAATTAIYSVTYDVTKKSANRQAHAIVSLAGLRQSGPRRKLGRPAWGIATEIEINTWEICYEN